MAIFNSPKNTVLFAWISLILHVSSSAQYLGKSLGRLGEFHHGVSGEVFAVDGRTLHIKDFTYDGQGPAAYFWAGSTKSVGNQGFRIKDENGNGDVLRRYRKEGVTLTLPEGKTLRDIKWFSVWCEEFEVNFGDVKIPRSFDFPRPQKLAALKGVHEITSDNIVIVDAQTLLIPNLSYDGEAPDAKFWTGPGPKPSPQGIRIPDENGKEIPLRRYDRKTVVLTLPGDLTVFDIGHFGIWCEAFTVDFGHIQIPQKLNVPPSLKMLGVSPQKRSQTNFLLAETAATRSQQLVGGNVEATTYRPSQFNINNQQQHILVQRRIVPIQHQNVVENRYVALQQYQNGRNPSGYVPEQSYQQNRFIQQPAQLQQHQILIQQSLQPQQVLQNPYVVQQQFSDRSDQFLQHPRQPVPYTPFNSNPQQFRHAQEEQLNQQLNRFVLGVQNYQFG